MGSVERIQLFTYTIGAHTLTVMDCAQCGEVFAVLAATVDVRRRDGRSLTCPNGHSNVFELGKSWQQRELEAAKAKAATAEREAARQRKLREWAEKNAKRSAIAAGIAKAAKKRLEHRVNCGVCPHCQRTFKQLAAHIKSKHPRA